jgi:cell division protein FtsQ
VKPAPPKRRAKVAPRKSERTVLSPELRSARRRSLLISLGVLTAFVVLLVGAAMSPLLDIRQVQVVGSGSAAHEAAIRRASGLHVGDSIVTVRSGSAARRVDDLPWVATANVSRHLPHIVRITVTERDPVAWVRSGSGAVVVDPTGRVLWRADAPPSGLPELVGVADIGKPGGLVRPVVLPATAAALGPDLGSRAATVQLDDGTVTVQVGGGPQLRFGAPTQLVAKARVASAVLAALGSSPVSYIDVTVPAAPVSG